MLEHQLEQIRSPTLHIVARERWASAAVKTKGKKKGKASSDHPFCTDEFYTSMHVYMFISFGFMIPLVPHGLLLVVAR